MTDSTGETLERIENSGVVAVLREIDPDDVIDIADALRDGGVTAIEITADHEDPEEMIESVRDTFGAELVVGAGTVLDEETARSVIDAGAEFIVSPVLNQDVIDVCCDQDRLVAPGVFTPTEAFDALEGGADFVKVFPAATLGPSYLRRLRGPLGDVPIMPTGGIDVSNAGQYIDSGAFAVGAGGALIGGLSDGTTDLDEVTERAERMRNAVTDAQRNRS